MSAAELIATQKSEQQGVVHVVHVEQQGVVHVVHVEQQGVVHGALNRREADRLSDGVEMVTKGKLTCIYCIYCTLHSPCICIYCIYCKPPPAFQCILAVL